jgi:hypothetical protein
LLDWKTTLTFLTIIITVIGSVSGAVYYVVTHELSAYETRLNNLENSQGQIEKLASELVSVNNSVNNLEYILGILTHPEVNENISATQQQESLVSIVYPSINGNVNWIEQIIGTSKIYSNKTLHLYLLVYPQTLSYWYVENNATINPDGTWWTTAYFGEKTSELRQDQVGQKFNLAAIITDDFYKNGEKMPELPSAISSAVVIDLVRGD